MEMIIAFCVFVLFFAAMALGLLFKGKPLKGSCGGIANVMGNSSCDICGGNRNKCEEWQTQQSDKIVSNEADDNGERAKDEKH